MVKELSSSYSIQIKSAEEINALNRNEIISADSSEMHIAHTKARIPVNRKKAAHIVPSEFEDWIESHNGDKEFVDLINVKVAPRKRRSLLSNVSYAYSSDESSNSEDDEEDDDFFSVNTVKAKKPPKPLKNVNTTNVSPTPTPTPTPTPKKSNWLSGLFHKQPKTSSIPPKPPIHKTFEPAPALLSNKNAIISHLFKKKQPPTKPAVQKKIPKLPNRYPVPIERVIYEISWMKLNNPRRPLLHHVSISNMMVWYTHMLDGRRALVYSQIPARSTSSHAITAVSR